MHSFPWALRTAEEDITEVAVMVVAVDTTAEAVMEAEAATLVQLTAIGARSTST
jgi:hypothetical protein